MNSQTRLTRRQMLHCSAGTLLAAGLWPGQLFAGDDAAADDFHFVAVNDLHYFDQHCGPWFERVTRRIKAHTEKIDFVLLVGDLSDQGKPEQLSAIRDIFKSLGLPLHAVIGNHDLKQGNSKAYEEAFPKSMNYRFEHRGWQFLGFDSCHGTGVFDVAVQPVTLCWLDDTLPKLDKKKPTVLFTHFPLGPNVLLRLTNADAVLDRFKEYNLRHLQRPLPRLHRTDIGRSDRDHQSLLRFRQA